MPNFKVYLVFFAIIVCAVAGFFGNKEYKAVSTNHHIETNYADAAFKTDELQSIHIEFKQDAESEIPGYRKNAFDVCTVKGIKAELACIQKMKAVALQYGDSLYGTDAPSVGYTITYHFKDGSQKELFHYMPALWDSADLSPLMETDEVKKQIGG